MIPIRGELFRSIDDTDYFDSHLADFSKVVTNKVITHNSDFSTSEVLKLNNNKEIFENSDWLWFAQNVDVKHPRIFSLPIGLENSEWFPELNKLNTILEYKEKYTGIKDIICVAEFNPRTHNRRLEVFKYYNDQDWCVTNPTVNGLSFDLYVENMVRSYFCISPRGNGIDTHRTWEAMYCGCIPIVERCINTDFYNDFPMLIVEDLTKITYDMLFWAWEEMSNTEYDFDKLYMDYWISYIKNA